MWAHLLTSSPHTLFLLPAGHTHAVVGCQPAPGPGPARSEPRRRLALLLGAVTIWQGGVHVGRHARPIAVLLCALLVGNTGAHLGSFGCLAAAATLGQTHREKCESLVPSPLLYRCYYSCSLLRRPRTGQGPAACMCLTQRAGRSTCTSSSSTLSMRCLSTGVNQGLVARCRVKDEVLPWCKG